MDTRQVDSMLRATIEDRRMSRSERQALAAALADLVHHRRDLEQLRARAFQVAEEALTRQRSIQVLHWLEEVVKTLSANQPEERSLRCEAVFSPGDACVRKLVELLRASRITVEICVFTITDNRISREILACHRRGVALRLVTDDAKAWDRGSDIAAMVDEGVSVRTDSSEAHMHHKFALFDRRLVATGSYNWTRSAADENQENLVVCDHPPLVRQFADEFERLWDRFAHDA